MAAFMLKGVAGVLLSAYAYFWIRSNRWVGGSYHMLTICRH